MSNTNSWERSPDYPGYRYKTIQKGSCTIQIFRPELDEGEQKKREAHVKVVAERALKEYYIRKKGGEDNETHAS